jgi:thiol-disulfide isomerase/thioredoxin
MNKLKLLCSLVLVTAIGFLWSCKTKEADKTKVIIYTRAPINSKLTIKNIAFVDEQEQVIDTATIKNNNDSLVLYLPRDEERLFKITLSGSRLEMIVVNDSKLLRIHVNYFFNKYAFQGSKASVSLKALADKRIAMLKERSRLAGKVDSLSKLRIAGKTTDSVKAELNLNIKNFRENDIAYADTVSSPAAFLEVNSLIDFENDFEGFKKFVIRASARFPGYAPLDKLKADAIATAKIFEEEYLVGDKLPPITLPNEVGLPYSTNTLQGKYYLIDFWSTWCQPCMMFTKAEYNLLKKKSDINFVVVSVALDDQHDVWKNTIIKNNFNWIQLIDEKMWQGTAVRTLKFDSIPFNFLVSPQGKILAKAIKPDSLEKVISRLDFNLKK